MDPIKTLGYKLSGPLTRDAVHVAIASVTSDVELNPGEHVAIVDAERHIVGRGDKTVGIVDPFLKEPIEPNRDQFWLWLYPGAVTTLRHQWTHPEFNSTSPDDLVAADQIASLGWEKQSEQLRSVPNPEPVVRYNHESIEWLTDLAHECDISYEEFIQGAKEENLLLPIDTPDRIYSERAEMLMHLRNIGINVKDEYFISCGC